MRASRPSRRRSVIGAGAALAALALLGVLTLRPFEGSGESAGSAAAPATSTATIERRTLVERESVDGTLTFSGSRTVINRLSGAGGSGGGDSGGGGSGGGDSGGGSKGDPGGQNDPSGSGDGGGIGTVTWLARPGTIVRPGGVLYSLDGEPVVLMRGSLPAYRRIGPGIADGPDVRQLERNLAALGFGDGVAIDSHFSAATAAAVKRWQRSLGLQQTGAVELGRVVFMPGARRIGSHETTTGAALGAGAAVMKTTSTRRVVKVALDVAKQSFVKRGDSVLVTLPSGNTVRGRIATLGRVARETSSGSGGEGGGGGSESGTGELVIDVSVVLRSRRGIGRLDQAPVLVAIARETKRNVLAVPVTALVARTGGGYAIETADRGRARLVPVRTGLFAEGLVEISGAGVREGTEVAVAE
jgi:peptidoglycan hydrolase-like protein with peptidoglycan-binding domain